MIRDVRGKEEGDKHISRERLSKYIVCIYRNVTTNLFSFYT